MSEPLVACVLLTADREEMTARAIHCFQEQTYGNRWLYIYDSGRVPCVEALPDGYPEYRIRYHRTLPNGRTVGALRNDANELNFDLGPDLFAHFDSDDWSHPQRLAEQVALIESDPTLDAVGYSDMLFWSEAHKWGGCRQGGNPAETESYEYVRYCETCGQEDTCEDSLPPCVGEAWLYTSTSSYLLGTSLLYRRAAWERKPFEHVNQGEDRRWLAGLRTKGASSTDHLTVNPRMVASIHGGNTSSRIEPSSENWLRVQAFDSYCRSVMTMPAAPTNPAPSPRPASQPTDRT